VEEVAVALQEVEVDSQKEDHLLRVQANLDLQDSHTKP